MPRFDAIIIGAGHNGLACGAYLAKQGLKVLVLERREIIGGCCTTEETVPGCPGFKINRGGVDHQHICSGPVPRELELEKHGLEFLWHEPLWFFPYDDGRAGWCGRTWTRRAGSSPSSRRRRCPTTGAGRSSGSTRCSFWSPSTWCRRRRWRT